MLPVRLSGALAAVGIALAAAACGGSATPTVAHIGSTTTTTASATATGPGKGPSLAQATDYADCMRSHGVPDFPDPTPGPGGGYGFKFGGPAGGGLNPNSSAFRTASKTCAHLLPNNGVGPQLTAAQQQMFLNWAACIRAHGVPNFPDPSFSGGGIRIRITAGPGGGGGPNGPTPQLQKAMQTCKSDLPAGFGFRPGG